MVFAVPVFAPGLAVAVVVVACVGAVFGADAASGGVAGYVGADHDGEVGAVAVVVGIFGAKQVVDFLADVVGVVE
ncbi:hypothetical protein [Nocardia abscessus]|uniref:hypothetical protein n=1 Tax=Nocardia abscessus TaxID=120957 RepID=UPI002457E9DA|nr:hypothetical protein [Nocardia abscessus]